MIMKKLLLLLSVFVLFSCEQEELDGLVDHSKAEVEQKAAVEGRAASTIADFDPIAELEDIPVNILNVGNTKNKYLSCVEKGNKVDLYNKDDGSLRQRWYVRSEKALSTAIILVGGNSSLPVVGPSNLIFVSPGYSSAPNMPPILMAGMPTPMNFILENDNSYKIRNNPPMFGSSLPIGYLQSETTTGSDLKFKESASNNLSLWELQPAESLEVLNMQYVFYDGGRLQAIPQLIKIRPFSNNSSIPIERSFTEAIVVTQTSTYSYTEGVTTQTKISNTTKVGGPEKPDESSNTLEQTTTNSWSFTQGGTQTMTTTMTDDFKFTIPPYTKFSISTYVLLYNIDVKYVATLRTSSGKIFKVKGKYNGVQAYELYGETKEEGTNKLVRIAGLKTNNK